MRFSSALFRLSLLGAAALTLAPGCDSSSSSSDATAGTGSGSGASGASGTAGSSTGGGMSGSAGAVGEAGSGGTEPGGDGGQPSAGSAGDGALAGAGGTAGAGSGSCEEPPQIMFVVSRSGGMFLGSPAAWHAVREAALDALAKVKDAADLGFMAVTGAADGDCPALEELAPAADNHAAISTMYESLAEPVKGESPFMHGLERAGELFSAGRRKFIVFVLNGEPDYCGDGNPSCPTDSVTARIQALRQEGITTFVAHTPPPFAFDEPRLGAYQAGLKGYANAGQGKPVVPFYDPNTLNLMCAAGIDSDSIAWKKELSDAGKPDTGTLATYAAAAGDVIPLALDPSDSDAMTAGFDALLESIIASCD